MALQELFRNNLYCSLFFLLVGACTHPRQTEPVQKVISSGDHRLKSENGIAWLGNEIFTGTVYTLYPGTHDTAVITSFRNGKEHGVWKKFYISGQLKEQREFADGKKTGALLAYWENGKKQLDYFFKDDEYEGAGKEWNSQGVLIRNMNYHKGHEEGAQKQMYDNGKIRSNYIIYNGRRYGLLGTKNCVNVSAGIFEK